MAGTKSNNPNKGANSSQGLSKESKAQVMSLIEKVFKKVEKKLFTLEKQVVKLKGTPGKKVASKTKSATRGKTKKKGAVGKRSSAKAMKAEETMTA